MLTIKDLKAEIDGKEILRGVNLHLKGGEIHAVMGPNGSGKSTLANVLAGHPAYTVSGGEVVFLDKNLLQMAPEERAREGLMLSFQHPLEIPGVLVASFLRMIRNKRFNENIPVMRFRKELEEKMSLLQLNPEFADRYLNEGFSGGEKKKMEILQMLVLEPKLVILDEVDSGLDIDALKNVADAVNWLKEKNPETSFLIITHYTRILKHIKADSVHIIKGGVIVKSGTEQLAHELEEKGYDNIV